MDSQQQEPAPDVHGPMLFLLRRLERAELIVNRLVDRGVIDPRELAIADLQSSLNHAERCIRIRKRNEESCEDLEQASSVVKNEIDSLEQELKTA